MNAKQRKQDQATSRFNKKVNREANTGIVAENKPDKERLIEDIEVKEEKLLRRGKKSKKESKDEEGNQ